METITILKIIFTALLCLPILGISIYLIGKLIDQMTRKPRKQR